MKQNMFKSCLCDACSYYHFFQPMSISMNMLRARVSLRVNKGDTV